ncbi:WD40 repeat domain-containing protein [Kribbella sp. NPDC055110]
MNYLMGKDVQIVPADQADSLVVLLSASAARDRGWLTEITQAVGARIIPVRVGPLGSDGLPGELSILNWIIWDPDTPDRSCALVFASSQTDLDSHRVTQGLSSRARIWVAGGRRDDALLDDLDEVASARAAQLDGADAKHSGLIAEFVERSATKVAAARRRRRRKRVVRYLLGSVAVVTIIALVFVARAQMQSFTLSQSASDAVADRRPDVQAIKDAATIMQSRENGKPADRSDVQRLVTALSYPWPRAFVGMEWTKAANGFAFLEDDKTAVVVDGGGLLVWYEVMTGRSVHSLDIGLERGIPEHVVSSLDGATVAVAADSALFVVSRSGGIEQTLPLAARDLQLTSDGHALVALVDNDLVTIHKVDNRWTAAQGRHYDDVLDLISTPAGSLSALVRIGGRIVVVDAVTGGVKSAWAFPAHTFEAGALGADGSVVLKAADKQIYWARSTDRSLQPSGISTADVVDALAILPGGLVVMSSRPKGTQLYLMPDGVSLGVICDELSYVGSVIVSPDGQLLACHSGGGFAVWSVQGRAPIARAMPHQLRPTGAPVAVSSPDGLVAVAKATRSGLIEVQLRSGAVLRLDPGGRASGQAQSPPPLQDVLTFSGEVTSLQLENAGSTLLLGTSDGVVLEVDVVSGSALMSSRWQAADRAAVRRVEPIADGYLRVTTDTFVWKTLSCAGCAGSPDRLIEQTRVRLLNCSPSSVNPVVPNRFVKALGIRICKDVDPRKGR